MKKTLTSLAIASLTLPFAIACASDGSSGTQASAANGGTTSSAPASTGDGSTTASAGNTGGTSGGTSGGSTTASTGGTGGTTGGAATGTGSNTSTRTGGGTPSIPSLVTVDLRNVLNDLAVKLNLDRANVPVTAQIPIQLAANVCGVSVNVLSVSTGGQANCTAKSAPQELAQTVQQQMAAGGSVGGGAQSTGAATGGASNTAGTSSGQGGAATSTPSTPPK